MVDEARLARLLRAIDERVARLATAARLDEATRGALWLEGVKYLFVTTIEACIDATHHITASDRLGAPDSNADALRLLGDHHIIDRDLAAALARAVGFRNVLVHQYTEVDDTIVVDALQQLDEFRQFVQQVSAWLVSTHEN